MKEKRDISNDDTNVLIDSLLNTTKASIHSLLLAVKSRDQLSIVKDALNEYSSLLEEKEGDFEEDEMSLEDLLNEVKDEETISHEEVVKTLFNNNIKKVREQKKISQVKLAEMLGKNASEISRWESGGVLPNMKNIRLISQALNCSIEELIQ